MKKDKITVPLKLITDAIEMTMDEWNQYLDIETMEVVSLPEDLYDEEDREMAELIDEGWNTRFFALPSKYDIHEYSIMESFIWSLPEGQMQNYLQNAIRGRGAFRRFKDEILRYGVEQSWYAYREEAYRKIAREWCEDHGFLYEEDRKPAAENTSVSSVDGRDPLS
ncbi:MAG: hypothetical protein IJX90_04020 [Blautia sp.]|nr:hypothetical protein [Blautia sp.]